MVLWHINYDHHHAEKKKNRETNNKEFILGSGFSKCADHPLQSEFPEMKGFSLSNLFEKKIKHPYCIPKEFETANEDLFENLKESVYERVFFYKTLLIDIKQRVLQAKSKANLSASSEMISMYWDIEKMLIEKPKIESWCAAVIPRLSNFIMNYLKKPCLLVFPV